MNVLTRLSPSSVSARIGWFALAIIALTGTISNSVGAHQYVRMDYNLTLNARSRHTVFLEVFDDRPLTQANFMQYVNAGKYDGSLIHRLSRNFVLQGGGFLPEFVVEESLPSVSLDPNAEVDLDGNPATDNPTVDNEFGLMPTRSNVKGTVAMAKVAGDPDSATSQWFFNLNNNTGLDTNNGGFTVFAQVLGDGMVYVDALNSGLAIRNFNPDIDDDGFRDGGPFYNYNVANGTDGVPELDLTLVVVEHAKRIDYFGGTGASNTFEIPAGGRVISERDTFIDTGTAFDVAAPGQLAIDTGLTLGVREGISIPRPLRNRGTLELGLDYGVVTVQRYLQFGDGTLSIDIRGTTVDTQYDRLVTTESATLAGTLQVDLMNQFTPVPGTKFTVLTANEVTGSFTNFDLSDLPGFLWQVQYTPTAVELSVIAGDYNDDGVVDAADYTVWRNALGTDYASAYSGADGNGDKTVDADDYAVWKTNYGAFDGSTLDSGAGAGGLAFATVPEPASYGLLLVAGTAVASLRRRRG